MILCEHRKNRNNRNQKLKVGPEIRLDLKHHIIPCFEKSDSEILSATSCLRCSSQDTAEKLKETRRSNENGQYLPVRSWCINCYLSTQKKTLKLFYLPRYFSGINLRRLECYQGSC